MWGFNEEYDEKRDKIISNNRFRDSDVKASCYKTAPQNLILTATVIHSGSTLWFIKWLKFGLSAIKMYSKSHTYTTQNEKLKRDKNHNKYNLAGSFFPFFSLCVRCSYCFASLSRLRLQAFLTNLLPDSFWQSYRDKRGSEVRWSVCVCVVSAL